MLLCPREEIATTASNAELGTEQSSLRLPETKRNIVVPEILFVVLKKFSVSDIGECDHLDLSSLPEQVVGRPLHKPIRQI